MKPVLGPSHNFIVDTPWAKDVSEVWSDSEAALGY